ncbi:MAG TPA: type II toxin-antitoxin system Phd/YefM family antitoxin [Azospirillaceae bacterium]|nr:type II toxin-antitoxin system Phd/YefM family antitoxin [Azospirillaceae bacterium]
MSTWQLQRAKAQLSEVVRRASEEGPQSITVHGRPVAVLISEAEYRSLKRPSGSIVDHILAIPPAGPDEEGDIFERSKDSGRNFDL